jgi:uncharacterized membrane protein YfcA
MPALPPLSPAQWALAVLAALCIGLSKSGFTGVGMVTVIIMSRIFPPRDSTGILLPMLIFGDLGTVLFYRRHAQWPQVWRLLPPMVTGVIAGFVMMSYIPDRRFSPVIGWIVLAMTVLQLLRRFRPALFQHVPHTRGFAWTMGLIGGVTTMLANAAGPVMALYFMAVDLPKLQFVGTSGWFFLMVNLFKVPFSWKLGLIHGSSLAFNILLMPVVALGTFLGRRLLTLVSQELFEALVLIFTTLASIRMIFS